MAKIIAEFDTQEKTLVVRMDGQVVDNVVGARFETSYGDEDDYCCSVTTLDRNEDEDMRTYTQVLASSGPQNEADKVRSDIESFFSKD